MGISVAATTRSKPVLLFLADISGYTQFMPSHDKALVHSQMIIGELTKTLIREVEFPRELVERNGDALFMYSPKTTTGDACHPAPVQPPRWRHGGRLFASDLPR